MLVALPTHSARKMSNFPVARPSHRQMPIFLLFLFARNRGQIRDTGPRCAAMKSMHFCSFTKGNGC